MLLAAFALAAIATPRADARRGCTPPPTAAARRRGARRVVTKVQAFYDKTTSFSSDFTQEFFVKSHNQKKTVEGQGHLRQARQDGLGVRRPRRTTASSPTARSLKVYEAANKQMFEQTVDKSQYPAALSFLTGRAS